MSQDSQNSSEEPRESIGQLAWLENTGRDHHVGLSGPSLSGKGEASIKGKGKARSKHIAIPLPHRPDTAPDLIDAKPIIPSVPHASSSRYAAQLGRSISAYPPTPDVGPEVADTILAPVPVPIPIPIDVTGASGITTNTHGPEGVRSPPTPVPSPRNDRISREGVGERARALSGMGNQRDAELQRFMQEAAPQVEQNVSAVSDMQEIQDGMGRLWADPQRGNLLHSFRALSTTERFSFLSNLVSELRMNEALVISRRIEPLLRRDMLRELPTELALHCMSFIDDAATLTRAARVSRYWNALLEDEHTWREMCTRHRFKPIISPLSRPGNSRRPSYNKQLEEQETTQSQSRSVQDTEREWGERNERVQRGSTFKQHYKNAFLTQANWHHGGRVLKDHISAADCVVTTVAMNAQYLVVGMATPSLHVFDTATCTWLQSFEGHQAGVWAVNIISASTSLPRSPLRDSTDRLSDSKGAPFQHFSKMRGSDAMGEVRGWGSRHTVVVSGGSDRDLRVWRVGSPHSVMVLQGHTSTIRCLAVLDRLPVCVTGSRDGTLRVWDIQKGQHRHLLMGHTASVRCLDVAGNLCVSGSYDNTAKVWNVMTGKLVHTLVGHFNWIYSVIFQWDSPEGQPARIVTGSQDASVRVWDATTGECLSLLQGHTALVGQMQISGNHLVTGGSDGRVILYDLASYECLHRICAHDNSITAIHFDERYIVSASNDGRIKLWDTRTGEFIRELSMPCEGVWRVAVRDDRVYILLSRGGKTVIEFLSFRPEEM